MKTKEFIEELKALVVSNELQSLAEICCFVGEKLSKKESADIEKRTIVEIISSASACFSDANDEKPIEAFIEDLDDIKHLVDIYEIADIDNEDAAHKIPDSVYAEVFLKEYESRDLPFAEKVMLISREFGSSSDVLKPSADLINIINATMAAKELGNTEMYESGIEVLKQISNYHDKTNAFQKSTACEMQVFPIYVDENGNAVFEAEERK